MGLHEDLSEGQTQAKNLVRAERRKYIVLEQAHMWHCTKYHNYSDTYLYPR